jgi:CheY-like chemotaxis protein
MKGEPMKKILIVDDDKDLRDVLKAVLSGSYTLKEAGSKKEALDVLKTFRPDLVLLDVMMESVNAGFELAREIKSVAALKKTRILMLTNVDKESHIDYKSEAGDEAWLPVDDYLVKPVDPNVLRAKVQKLI